ncbi:hypothetical protein [Amycolatopsis jiangsuensis]|uniref:Intracellular septation protein A n=1 Tax=Amycolatopsis jiangsuensis TaxID=1181879 RepID=A0A840ILL8_9PSEU|nr:hypothetical protein [Amycolatopsis jiangsuensis]MBB4682833.1 hypothetical protein [Amycolatopsis jiangsuensis]
MNYLKSFLPWIVFAIVSTQADWRWSGLVGLVLAGGLLAVARREGRGWDCLVIELSALGFFTVLTVFSLSNPDSPLREYVGASSDVWLAITAWGSIALRRPFTLGIAKTTTPQHLWQRPAFRRTNLVITAVWASSLTVAGVAGSLLLGYAPHATIALIALKILAFVVPVVFTIRYVTHVRARAQKAA